MIRILKLVLIIGLFSHGSVFSYDGYSEPTTVEMIFTRVNASPYIQFGGGSLQGCYGNSGAYLPHLDSNEQARAVYSLLLSAKMANKKVRVYYKYNDHPADYNGWGLCNIESVSIR